MTDKRQKLLQNMIEKLSQALRDMHKGQSFPLGDFMLGKQQIMILFFIDEQKGATSVKEVAKYLQVTPGAITQFVDGLVEKKLVKREENLADRRSINIKLTEATKKRFNDFKKKYLASASKAFSGFSDQELEQFTELIKKMKAPVPLKKKNN